MARSKKGKPHGKGAGKPGLHTSPGSSPRTFDKANEGARYQDFTPSTFTMRDAARLQQPTPWSPATKLRHKAMSFVKSADRLEGEDEKKRESQTPTGKPALETEEAVDSKTTGEAALNASANRVETSPPKLQVAEVPRQLSSPTPSNSSEDVVVFTGRRDEGKPGPFNQNAANANATAGRTPVWDNLPDAWIDQREQVKQKQTDYKTGARAHMPGLAIESRALTRPMQDHPATLQGASSLSSLDNRATYPAIDQANITTNKCFPVAAPRNVVKVNMDEATKPQRQSKNSRKEELLEDYIANMRENGMADDSWETEDTDAEIPDATRSAADALERAHTEAAENHITSDESLDDISQVLSKRRRSSGSQYLIVASGQTIDQARWMRKSQLNFEGAVEKITAFEMGGSRTSDAGVARQQQNTSDASRGHDIEISGSHADSETNAEQEWEDEEESEARLISQMDDEQIARLLSKQEELGIGSEQLLIFDEFQYYDGDVPTAIPSSSSHPPGARRSKHRQGRSRRELSQATFLAEEEDEDDELFGNANSNTFDVMDWERLSLQPKNGRSSDLALSDSSLERTIHDSWSKDRQKKKARKQEREELRAQGLLGAGKKSKRNVAARYHNGLPFDEFRKDLEEFLDNDQETMALPPMEKRERKVIHEIAAAFNCKSKSNGSGATRFPIIYKTRRTIDFDDGVFDRVEQKLSRRFFSISASERKTTSKSSRVAKGGAGGRANGGFNYREGETVGAGASEIGSENRGRAMLEKMGWSKGTALGALDNKGILIPIEHVVKTSRAGLG